MDLVTQNVLCKCADRLIQVLILLPVPLQQHLQPQLVQLLVQLALPAQQQHPLFSQTQLHLLYQQPEWNMPICSAINHHQETRAVDLIMEEGCCEPIVQTCRTTEDRCGQEPLFALRPLLQANCQPQPREWHWHWIGWGKKDRISKQWKWYASSSVHCSLSSTTVVIRYFEQQAKVGDPEIWWKYPCHQLASLWIIWRAYLVRHRPT